ncbi:response regulator transcription factor [Arthrobacter tumbae]|uniref:response regulator transcription factor n=1 Tax=Arthrobacter tumbae TaxID=163874 RepID=UPI00195BC5D8|nr:response regulator transcription factor [Arthrobacter tumbae]MBM7780355.1 DNA-binding response OmpR family regulator [Arthrobacter tumbae]
MPDPGVAVVVEDDLDVRNLVSTVLTQSGFVVHTAAEGRDGVEAVKEHNPTLVTLDVGLPDIDGYEVLRRIRGLSDCYVIMLTAHNEEIDTLTALQSGADDFVTKPFRPRELRARIAAMLRRPRGGLTEEKPTTTTAPASEEPNLPSRPDSVMRHNGLELDKDTRTVTVRGEELVLTRSEFDLLHELLRSSGAVRTKGDLVRVVRGQYYRTDTYISEADERAIEVHIGNLRRKLGEDPRSPRWLMTVRGVGYRLVPRRAD